MTKVLVLASETIGGAALIDAVKERGAQDDVEFLVVVPQTRPRHGNVIYADAVRDAAQVRVDLVTAFMRAEGLQGRGEVGDPDPFTAAMDACDEYGIDEVIVSTRPAATSGWLRRDLPERIQQASGKPVKHVVVDIDREGLPFDVTLVAANQTVAGPELTRHLEELAAQGPRRFIVVVPQDSGDGRALHEARARLDQLLRTLTSENIVAAGFVGAPDPYDAVMNALQVFYISEIVVSTLPENRSKWLEKGLLDRLRRVTDRPIHHVESTTAEPAATGS